MLTCTKFMYKNCISTPSWIVISLTKIHVASWTDTLVQYNDVLASWTKIHVNFINCFNEVISDIVSIHQSQNLGLYI